MVRKLWPWLVALGCVLVGASLVRTTTIANEHARVADSTAKVEQRRRLQTENDAARARARADSLTTIVAGLTRVADSAAARAAVATREARRATNAREAAIAALHAAAGLQDSVTALIAKSTADDSVIDAQTRVIAAKSDEVGALRTGLDSAAAIRFTLVTALDSARVQLARDGRIVEQLQRALKQAHPGFVHRWADRAVSGAVGYTIRAITSK